MNVFTCFTFFPFTNSLVVHSREQKTKGDLVPNEDYPLISLKQLW